MKLLALSLILCWGLNASAESELKKESPNGDDLMAEISWGVLKDVLLTGQKEQPASRAEDDLSGDEDAQIGRLLLQELGPQLDNGLLPEADSSLAASDRWGCNKKCRRRKRRRKRRKRARRAARWAECQRQAKRGNPGHVTCRRHFRSLRKRRRRKRGLWGRIKGGFNSFKKKWDKAWKRKGIFGRIKDGVNKQLQKIPIVKQPYAWIRGIKRELRFIKEVIKEVRAGMIRIRHTWKMIKAVRSFVTRYKPAPDRMLLLPDQAPKALKTPELHEEDMIELNE